MKKFLLLFTVIIMAVVMSKGVFAEETKVELTRNRNLSNDLNDIIKIDTAKAKMTGEVIEFSQERAGQALSGDKGLVSGTLTTSNTWDYYIISSDTKFSTLTKISTDNNNYTMTLGFVDYVTGVINLTDYVCPANKLMRIDFAEGGVYAWVIQSSDGTYGSSYQFSYNKGLTESTQFVYVTEDFQKLYGVDNQKLTLNGKVQNIDYRYDSEWEIPSVGGGLKHWNKIHVWMVNANVKPIHVGGCKWYESATLYDFPHTIVFEVLPGGTFTHKFSQNPPYYNWYNKDSAGIETPRAITNQDWNSRGGHYLVYDLNSDKVVQFASGLTKPWSDLGDSHHFGMYEN